MSVDKPLICILEKAKIIKFYMKRIFNRTQLHSNK